MRLFGAYIIEPFYRELKEKDFFSDDTIKSLSEFDLQIAGSNTFDCRFLSNFQVLSNLISRGCPTRLTLELEEHFAKIFNLSVGEVSGRVVFKVTEQNEDFISKYWQAFHIIDPRLGANEIKKSFQTSWENLGSEFEEDFLFKKLPGYLGDDLGKIAVQLFDTQREFDTLVSNEFVTRWQHRDFSSQRADFVLQFPTAINAQKGFIVEVDGSQHNDPQQRMLDEQRDKATFQNDWGQTIRIRTSEWNNMNQKLELIKNYLSDKSFEPYKNNIQKPLYSSKESYNALFAALAPIAIARVQKTILELIINGNLDLNLHKWNFCFVERDIAVAEFAIDDLKNQIKNIFELSGIAFKLPEISISLYASKEFIGFSGTNRKLIDQVSFDDTIYELVIDYSVLQREGIPNQIKLKNPPPLYATVRSVKSNKGFRKLHTGDLIKYLPVSEKIENEQYKPIEARVNNLKYFLNAVFRNRDFLPGQLPILNKALQCESIIGLLPTGGGKSLTYQLACVMQPGITMVVDPIKSLMQDQVQELFDAFIDSCSYINSSVKGKKRAKAEFDIANGSSLFCFVSPERLQIVKFREMLGNMITDQIYFSYFVIDEAHCVSEWGHDFRTSYLSLGENARRYCKIKGDGHLPIFGLTATASFDVLADVQRELSPKEGVDLGEDSVVRFETVKRKELQFKIVPVSISDEIEQYRLDKGRDPDDFSKRIIVGEKKQKALNELLRGMPEEFNKFNTDLNLCFDPTFDNAVEDFAFIQLDKKITSDFYNTSNTNAGLVFCPHRRWYFGVTDLYRLRNQDDNFRREPHGIFENIQLDILKGTFLGADDSDGNIAQKIELDNEENQNKFKRNELALLVSTKAFGMGINKRNIRYTVHNNYPPSIESYVQEAGRAGRDKKLAISFILYNDENNFKHRVRKRKTDSGEFETIDVSLDKSHLLHFHNNSFKGQDKEKWTLFELLNEISYPAKKTIDSLNIKLNEEYGIDAKLSYWQSPQTGRGYLFVQKSFGEKYGALLLPELEESYRTISFPLDECQTIVKSIRKVLLELAPADGNITAWILNSLAAEHSDGIETKLVELNINEPFNVAVGFTTDWDFHISKLVAILLEKTGYNFSKEQIREAYKPDYLGFIEDLTKLNQGLTQNLEDDKAFASKVKNLYYKLRDKSDTEKAIYRLSTIGIINDYSVDFNSATFLIKGKKHSDETYIENLRKYIHRYYSEKRTEIEIQNLQNRKGNSVIQKCLNYLVDFVYREVEAKRYQAIDAMRQACDIGVNEGNVPFKEFVDLYFHSKYARNGYEVDGENASLLDIVYGKDADIDVVWKFIELIGYDPSGSQIDNLKHLRGACIRILISQPDDACLLLLKAFSEFVLELNRRIPSEKTLGDARDSFIKGFIEFRKGSLSNSEDLFEAINFYRQKLIANCPDNKIEGLIDEAIELLKLKMHLNWVQNFNNDFLYDYSGRNTSRTAEVTE
ncbi:MAG: DEAD/DEAH box helicase [bacterium]|nr:DEAD/DEAH box helicase [bacterium]